MPEAPAGSARKRPPVGFIIGIAALAIVGVLQVVTRPVRPTPAAERVQRRGVGDLGPQAGVPQTPAPSPAVTRPPAEPAKKSPPMKVPGPDSRTAAPGLPADHPPIDRDEGSQVSIQWLGYSCFYIHSPGGVAVVTDPFDPKATGLPKPDTGAHLVTVSARSPEHDFVDAVRAFRDDTRRVVRGSEARRGDIRIVPVPTYRDATGGGREGRNVAYVIETGGLRIAHLGDLGHVLNPAQLAALGKIDILLLPVGESGLGAKEAVAIARQVNPRMVVPMAYDPVGSGERPGKLRSLDAFIAASPYAVTAKESDIMMVSKAELPASTEVVTLRLTR